MLSWRDITSWQWHSSETPAKKSYASTGMTEDNSSLTWTEKIGEKSCPYTAYVGVHILFVCVYTYIYCTLYIHTHTHMCVCENESYISMNMTAFLLWFTNKWTDLKQYFFQILRLYNNAIAYKWGFRKKRMKNNLCDYDKNFRS